MKSARIRNERKKKIPRLGPPFHPPASLSIALVRSIPSYPDLADPPIVIWPWLLPVAIDVVDPVELTGRCLHAVITHHT